MSETTPARATSNQSTEKAFAVLELLSEAQGPMRLRDISTALGLNSSTALRFVNALQNCGYAAQDPDTQRYYLTFKICRVANQMRSHTELLPIVRPFMEALFQEIHEALCLAVEQDMCMLYLDVRMRQNQRLMNMQQVGNSSPLHSTGIGKLLLLETVSYAESSMCRRKTLLHYFGEEYPEENCGCCDNCLHPKPKIDAQASLRMALEALRDLGDKFKADYLASVLVGKNTALIKSYGHNKSEWFGAGADHDIRYWGAVIRQALIMGLIDKNIENYGLLSINAKGEEFIAAPRPVYITLDHDYDEEEKETDAVAPTGKGGAADEELFSMLKDLRKKVARQHDLPPFVIFQDPSLEDMAIQYPITIEEMQNISGVGVGKARKFGEEFIRLIRTYVEEKEIVRPQDMIVKSVGNKSGNKIFIIQAIDRKMDFEDIARAKDLDFDELLTEIEGIVNSGTKLDISYYIEQVIDEDKSNDIYLYFKEDAQSDSLDEAIEELGGDYTEEEIRLVRIKFMCEQGN